MQAAHALYVPYLLGMANLKSCASCFTIFRLYYLRMNYFVALGGFCMLRA
jgi:hypothetical protein